MGRYYRNSDIGTCYTFTDEPDEEHRVVKKHGSFYLKLVESDTGLRFMEGSCTFKDPEIKQKFEDLKLLLREKFKEEGKKIWCVN